MTKIPFSLREKIDNKAIDDGLTNDEHIDFFIRACERQATLTETHELRTHAHAHNSQPPTKPHTVASEPPRRYAPSTHLAAAAVRPPRGDEKPSLAKGNIIPLQRHQECIFHPTAKAAHSTFECRKIMSMSSRELRKCLSENKLCLKCFGKHQTMHCRSRISCPEEGCEDPSGHCKAVHLAVRKTQPSHALVSAEAVEQLPQAAQCELESSHALVSVNSSRNDIPSQLSLSANPQSQTERSELNTQLGYNTIRPCHAAFVRQSNGTMRKVQVLYDSGADLSQVVTSVAQESDSKPVNTVPELLMHVAGSKEVTSFGKTELYVIPIYDHEGRCIVNLRCVAVDYIGKTRSGNLDAVKTRFEPEHDLSDLLEPRKGEIHVLIGCNYPSLLPRPICSRGTITLAESKFGLVMFGSDPSFPGQSYERKEPTAFLENAVQLTAASIMVMQSKAPVETTVIPRSDRSSLPSSPQNQANHAVKAGNNPPSSSVSTLSTAEKDLYDRMAALDDQMSCYRCGACPLSSSIDRENERRLALYQSCLTYHPDQKLFTTKMPWIESFSKLPDNRNVAIKRLKALTNSMAEDKEMRTWYIEEFDKIVAKGVLVEVGEQEHTDWLASGGRIWYVNHFPVRNEVSASTSLRPVFDATASYRGYLLIIYGKCLPT